MRKCLSSQVEAEGLDVTCVGGGGPAASRAEVRATHVLLCADVCKELSKASLCVQAWREEEGARAVMLATEFRIGATLLEEEGHDLEGILCQGLFCAKGPRREDQDIKARREELRDEWWVYPRFSRRGMAHQGIPAPTHSHECVDPRLDTL